MNAVGSLRFWASLERLHTMESIINSSMRSSTNTKRTTCRRCKPHATSFTLPAALLPMYLCAQKAATRMQRMREEVSKTCQRVRYPLGTLGEMPQNSKLHTPGYERCSHQRREEEPSQFNPIPGPVIPRPDKTSPGNNNYGEQPTWTPLLLFLPLFAPGNRLPWSEWRVQARRACGRWRSAGSPDT